MNDKYIIADVLNNEKSLVVNMAIALNEASSPIIYEKYLKIFNDQTSMQSELFNLDYNKEFYTLEEANKLKILDELNCLKKELNKK